jgi:hypothetical protein
MTSPPLDHHTPDDDKTPGRDALTLAFFDPARHEMSQYAMKRMPDEWQGKMAALINEFAVQYTSSN